MNASFFVLAYLSPETYLPISSVVATVIGVVMMFGRNSLRLAALWFRRITARRKADRPLNAPHFARTRREGSRTEQR